MGQIDDDEWRGHYQGETVYCPEEFITSHNLIRIFQSKVYFHKGNLDSKKCIILNELKYNGKSGF